jgi:hypothetical protein
MKWYLLFMAGCLLFSLAYTPTGKDAIIFCVSIIVASIIAVGICFLASKWRLWAVDFVCPLAVILRALAAYYTIKLSLNLECYTTTLDTARKFFNLTLFFTDLILFKTSFYTTMFVTFPTLIATGAVNMSLETSKNTPLCPSGLNDMMRSFFILIPAWIPFMLSQYMQTLGELRLFLLGETLTKQQQIMLEIFEQQNEGVVLLQKPKKKDSKDGKEDEQPKSEVLYINNALKRIINSAESTDPISIPILKVKSEEQTQFDISCISSENFSI